MTTQQSNPLATDKISTLIARFSVPSIIAMLVSAVYNIADQLFIGNAVGTLGNAATNIAFPLAMMCTGLGLLFGIGGAAAFNLHMGANKKEEAPYFVGNSIMMLMTTGVLLFLLTELFLTPLLIGFGSPSNVLPLARQYVRVTAIGFPFLILTIGSGHLIRADGSPKMAMFVNISGAVINIGLDPLLIFGFHMGVAGAAIATVSGQFISFLVLLIGSRQGDNIRISLSNVRLNAHYLKEIINAGTPALMRQGLAAIATLLLNHAAGNAGSDAAIAGMSVVTRVMMLLASAMIGFGQGYQPVCGFNYGAHLYDRVKEGYFFCVKYGTIFLAGASALCLGFAPQIIRFFRNDPDVISVGAVALRAQAISLPLMATIVITNMMLQACGKGLKASIVSAARNGIFFVPLILILPRLLGLFGVEITQAVSDVLSFVLAIPFAASELKKM